MPTGPWAEGLLPSSPVHRGHVIGRVFDRGKPIRKSRGWGVLAHRWRWCLPHTRRLTFSSSHHTRFTGPPGHSTDVRYRGSSPDGLALAVCQLWLELSDEKTPSKLSLRFTQARIRAYHRRCDNGRGLCSAGPSRRGLCALRLGLSGISQLRRPSTVPMDLRRCALSPCRY